MGTPCVSAEARSLARDTVRQVGDQPPQILEAWKSPDRLYRPWDLINMALLPALAQAWGRKEQDINSLHA